MNLGKEEVLWKEIAVNKWEVREVRGPSANLKPKVMKGVRSF